MVKLLRVQSVMFLKVFTVHSSEHNVMHVIVMKLLLVGYFRPLFTFLWPGNMLHPPGWNRAVHLCPHFLLKTSHRVMCSFSRMGGGGDIAIADKSTRGC